MKYDSIYKRGCSTVTSNITTGSTEYKCFASSSYDKVSYIRYLNWIKMKFWQNKILFFSKKEAIITWSSFGKLRFTAEYYKYRDHKSLVFESIGFCLFIRSWAVPSFKCFKYTNQVLEVIELVILIKPKILI